MATNAERPSTFSTEASALASMAARSTFTMRSSAAKISNPLIRISNPPCTACASVSASSKLRIGANAVLSAALSGLSSCRPARPSASPAANAAAVLRSSPVAISRGSKTITAM